MKDPYLVRLYQALLSGVSEKSILSPVLSNFTIECFWRIHTYSCSIKLYYWVFLKHPYLVRFYQTLLSGVSEECILSPVLSSFTTRCFWRIHTYFCSVKFYYRVFLKNPYLVLFILICWSMIYSFFINEAEIANCRSTVCFEENGSI